DAPRSCDPLLSSFPPPITEGCPRPGHGSAPARRPTAAPVAERRTADSLFRDLEDFVRLFPSAVPDSRPPAGWPDRRVHTGARPGPRRSGHAAGVAPIAGAATAAAARCRPPPPGATPGPPAAGRPAPARR